MEKISEFAIFYYQKQDENIVGELSDYLDLKAKKIFAFFKINNRNEKVRIKIIPTKKEFDEIFELEWGFESSPSSRGFYKNKEIIYLSLNDYKNTTHTFEKEDYQKALEGFKKTLLHEFVHYVNELFKFENKCGYTEKYLREGIAIYLSGQKEERQIDFNYTFNELVDNSNECYDGYYLLSKYLIENYKIEFIFEILRSNRKAKEFLANELYNKVHEYYKNKVSR